MYVVEVRADKEGRGWGGRIRWVLLGCVALVAAALLYQWTVSFLVGPVPSMSLVPGRPDDVEIVVNKTEYSDGAGGTSARLLVLDSEVVSPDEVVVAMTEAFDTDKAWLGGDDGQALMPSDWHRDPCAEESISASVWVAADGESVDIGQFDTHLMAERAAVVRISILYHPFRMPGQCQ